MRTSSLAAVAVLVVPLVAFLAPSCSSDDGSGLDGGNRPADSSLGNQPDGYVDPNDPVAQCQTVGGAISQALCCKTAKDFPDQCVAGACGCDVAESKETTICTCPGNDLCWNGKRCIPR